MSKARTELPRDGAFGLDCDTPSGAGTHWHLIVCTVLRFLAVQVHEIPGSVK